MQTDKRNLAQKAMLQDIKDVAEKRRAEDHRVYLPTTSFHERLTPDLTFQNNHRYPTLPMPWPPHPHFSDDGVTSKQSPLPHKYTYLVTGTQPIPALIFLEINE